MMRAAVARLALVVALAFAAGAAAQERAPMTGPEFRAATEGWTLHFRDANGEYFGSEQYFEGGRTMWLPRGGQCEPGAWVAQSNRICFLYAVGRSCWRLWRDGDGIYAESDDGRAPGTETRLWSVKRDKQPVLCPDGPGV